MIITAKDIIEWVKEHLGDDTKASNKIIAIVDEQIRKEAE